MSSNPLVSIIVITYNSSATIIESLESFKEQTYKNLELIITDDCSKDNTVQLCKDWLDKNKCYFVRTELVETPKNTGVPANLNRGIKCANGEWIKSIAGDDLLVPEAIESYVHYVINHADCRICMAELELFGCDDKVKCDNMYFALNKKYEIIASHDRRKQYRKAILYHILPGPGIFYQKSLWANIGGFDERYSLAEEWTFEVKVLTITPVYLLDKKLVKWRLSPNSLSNNKKSKTVNHYQQYYWDDLRDLIRKEYGYGIMIDADLREKHMETGKIKYKVMRMLMPFSYIRKYLID